MAARFFLAELEAKIPSDATMFLLKRPLDPVALTENSGYIRGLQEAKLLYEEVIKHNQRMDDET
jgi:hypothetical protein